MMNVKTLSGFGLVGFAVVMTAINMSDTLSDLSNWHAATTPAFVAAILKQLGAVLTGTLGGYFLPPYGVGSPPPAPPAGGGQ
jgi:hypothetical protein